MEPRVSPFRVWAQNCSSMAKYVTSRRATRAATVTPFRTGRGIPLLCVTSAVANLGSLGGSDQAAVYGARGGATCPPPSRSFSVGRLSQHLHCVADAADLP